MTGIMMLVPGTIGVKGVTALIGQNVLTGVQFGFEVTYLSFLIVLITNHSW